MFNVNIEFDEGRLNGVINALEMLRDGNLPNTAKAVNNAAIAVQQRWKDNAKGAFKHASGEYIRRIEEGLIYPYEGDPYMSAVINTSPHAKYIEDGTPPHNLKKALKKSHQVRISKNRKRYLIIPFRHGTPRTGVGDAGMAGQRATLTSMPQSVYERAKELAITRRIGGYTEPSVQGRGQKAYRNIYRPGERLKGMGDFGKRPEWKSSPYEGMIRVTREESMRSGTMYMTFRVMHEDSQGWLHPGTPPLKLAERTANEMRPVVTEIIMNGFDQDLKEMGF